MEISEDLVRAEKNNFYLKSDYKLNTILWFFLAKFLALGIQGLDLTKFKVSFISLQSAFKGKNAYKSSANFLSFGRNFRNLG